MRPRLLVLLGLLAASVVLLQQRSRVQAWASGSSPGLLAGTRAPELPADTRALDGAPQRLADLRGQVVLLHFWTFACGNCEHMLPAYTAWHARYAAQGLRVIGVHTPELPHERDPQRLRAFVTEHRLPWTVVPDAGYLIWDRYQVRAWPTIYLVDRKGQIAASFVGDDHAAAIEAAIKKLL